MAGDTTMTTQNIGLFEALGAKMDYLNHRQRLISQNIAHADTPNYRPQDLTPVDFGRVLDKAIGEKSKTVRLETTDKNHLPPAGELDPAKSQKQKKTYEVAPAGNAVVMEEQLIKSNQTIVDYNLITSLYQKNMGLIKTALGRGV